MREKRRTVRKSDRFRPNGFHAVFAQLMNEANYTPRDLVDALYPESTPSAKWVIAKCQIDGWLKDSIPSVPICVALADHFGVTIGQLLGIEYLPPP